MDSLLFSGLYTPIYNLNEFDLISMAHQACGFHIPSVGVFRFPPLPLQHTRVCKS